jgi:hypothetical protein
MRLYTLFMERDGRKVPIGTFVSGSEQLSLADLPCPPNGVTYLDPEEVMNTDTYTTAFRRYEEMARLGPNEEARDAECIAVALKRRLSEIRCDAPH